MESEDQVGVTYLVSEVSRLGRVRLRGGRPVWQHSQSVKRTPINYKPAHLSQISYEALVEGR